MDTLSESTSNKETDARSALASAAGFMYQTLIFIDNCCQLNYEETVLYEKFEDITTISNDNKKISYIQVKQKSSKISLHDLIVEINRFWKYAHKNICKTINYTYLSTEDIRGEKKRITFNGKTKKGIEIWQNLEQHREYLEPLISYLQEHDTTEQKIKEFLEKNKTTPIAIITSLIRPFIIRTKNSNFEDVERQIHESKLVHFIRNNRLNIKSSYTLYCILAKKIEKNIQEAVKAKRKSIKISHDIFISLLNESYQQQNNDTSDNIQIDELNPSYLLPTPSLESNSIKFDSYPIEKFQGNHSKMNSYIKCITTAITENYSLQSIVEKITQFISYLYKYQWNSTPEKLFSLRMHSSEHLDFFSSTNLFINKLKSFTKQELIDEFNKLIMQLNNIFTSKGTLA